MERVSQVVWSLSTRTLPSILTLLAWGSVGALGVEPDVLRVAMPVMESAPVIDGAIGEEEWKQAVRNVGHSGIQEVCNEGKRKRGEKGKGVWLALSFRFSLFPFFPYRREMDLDEE